MLIAVVTTAAIASAGLLALLRSGDAGDRDGTGRTDSPPASAVLRDGGREPDDVSLLPGLVGFSSRWNGAAFIQDNLFTDGSAEFALWVGPRGEPIVGRRDGPRGAWSTSDLSDIAGNPLDAPTVADPHNVYSIATDRAGHVHVAGNMHASELRYVRSRVPGAIDDWVAVPMTGSDESAVTYPTFVRRGDGPLLFFYRNGGSVGGDLLVNRFDEQAGVWHRVATLFEGRGRGETMYLHHVASDPDGRSLHVFLLRRSGVGPEANGDVAYLRYDDHGTTTWRDWKDRPVTLPLGEDPTATLPIDVAPAGQTLLNQGGAVVDDLGRPHALFRVRGPDTPGATVVHVWNDGDTWRSERLDLRRTVAGRPALVAGPGTSVSMLWSEPHDDGTATVWSRPLGAADGQPEVRLATIPAVGWEPTYDSVAHDSRRMLRVLLPTEAWEEGDGRAVGRAAIASYDLAGKPKDSSG